MSVEIISNPNKKWAIELRNKLIKKRRVFENKGNYTIIIGGDGTFLYNKSRIKGIAMLIGSETSKRAHINYSEDMGIDEITKRLRQMMKKPSFVELPLLEIENSECNAINDVVIHSSNHSVVEIEIKGKNFSRVVKGDGAIISTPFGSLAYNKSAGGSEISLGLEALSISFISQISCFPPLIVPMGEIEAKVIEGEGDLIIDGICKTKFIKRVRIKPSKKSVKYYI